MSLLVIPAAALALAFALTLWTGRDGVVAGIGVVIFLALAVYQAAPARETDGAGEPIDGAAGVALVFLWAFVPWIAGLSGRASSAGIAAWPSRCIAWDSVGNDA